MHLPPSRRTHVRSRQVLQITHLPPQARQPPRWKQALPNVRDFALDARNYMASVEIGAELAHAACVIREEGPWMSGSTLHCDDLYRWKGVLSLGQGGIEWQAAQACRLEGDCYCGRRGCFTYDGKIRNSGRWCLAGTDRWGAMRSVSGAPEVILSSS